MPLAGTQEALASSMKSDIISKMSQFGQSIVDDRFLQAFCEAVAETVIAHIIANAQVITPPGVAVQVAFPAGTGATVAPGIGTVV